MSEAKDLATIQDGNGNGSGAELRLVSTGRPVLTLAEMGRFQDLYKRSSVRARKNLVSTYLLQGIADTRLAQILQVPVGEIRQHYRDALEEISEQLECVPEGPMLLAQVVIQGYSRLYDLSSHTILAMLEKVLSQQDPDHESVRAYVRLRFELLDKITDRMEKYGLLPVVPKGAIGHGGVRSGTLAGGPDKLATFLQEIAIKAGLDLEAEKQVAIESSVRGGSTTDGEMENNDLPSELLRENVEGEQS